MDNLLYALLCVIAKLKNAYVMISGIFDSSSIASNRDGNLFERTEFIMDSISTAPPVRLTQSVANSVPEGAYGYFNVQLYNVDGDPYLENTIDITSGVIVLEKSTLGGEFSNVGITQPTLEKGLGHIDCSVLFKNSEWEPDDLYRLSVTGVTVTNGEEHRLSHFVWNNMIAIVSDIDIEVDAILEHITVPSIDNVDDESIADIIGTKGDNPKTDLKATIMNNIKALFASGLSKRITISEIISNTSFKTADLPALGSGGLIGWYIFCSLDAGGLGGAPQGEYRIISNWVNGASGTFTHESFSVPLTTSDKVIIVHPSIYNMITMMPEIEKIQDIKTIVEAITGFALDSTVAKATSLVLVKTETDKIPATITKMDNLIANTNFRDRVYPTLANGVNVTGGAGAWALSANYVQIVPVNIIASEFKITEINVSVLSANDTYELVLYSGTVGNEVEITRIRFTKVSNDNVPPYPLNTDHIPANSRISAKLATSTGGDNITMSIKYHYS